MRNQPDLGEQAERHAGSEREEAPVVPESTGRDGPRRRHAGGNELAGSSARHRPLAPSI